MSNCTFLHPIPSKPALFEAFPLRGNILIFPELDLPVKTTTLPTPIRHNIEVPKSRKSPPHTKNKPVKFKRPKTERKSSDLEEVGTNNEEMDVTTSFWFEPKTAVQETSYPSASKSPPWVFVNNTSNVTKTHCIFTWVIYVVAIILMLN